MFTIIIPFHPVIIHIVIHLPVDSLTFWEVGIIEAKQIQILPVHCRIPGHNLAGVTFFRGRETDGGALPVRRNR